MPTVIISRDSQFVKVAPLGAKTHIGRSLENDIVLDAAGISRVHALIDHQDSSFVLIDEDSTNGTYIKDQRIRHHVLTNGTSFRILDYLLTFVEDVHSKAPISEDLTTATLIEDKPQQMLETLWLTQHVTRKKGLQQKVYRLLKMVSDIISSPGDADAGNLVLDALFEITGAKRGAVAMKQRQGDPILKILRGFDTQGQRAKISRTILQKVIDEGTSVFLRRADKESPTESIFEYGLKSVLCVPLTIDEQTIGCVYLDHPELAGVFSETDRDLLVAAADHIAEIMEPEKRKSGHPTGKDGKLAEALKHHGIIAYSPKTLKVFRDSQTIARYNVSVLIFGETGTGKEILSRYIHEKSGRSGRFIARNCSAIAASMFESELFGHEKGAFTGAAERKLGILELADQGTLFLDEIGDMPAEAQAKMLRALQEQEIWRVGGSAPVKIDVRVIAATHKDIKTKRKELNFRDDLYYRLANVEITAPSLRERTEDIAPLCASIFETLGEEHLDEIKSLSLSPKALRLLEAYDWPGNIRELRNTLIQVSLRCDGNVVEPRHLKGLIDVFSAASKPCSSTIPSLLEVERVHIVKALKCTNWNKSAAAKMLEIDRNRLNRRLKKFGIDTPKAK